MPEIDYYGFLYDDEPKSGYYDPSTGNLYLCQYANFPFTVTDTWYNCYYKTSVNTGKDGICDTTALSDDDQVIDPGDGESNTVAITEGVVEGLQTTTIGNDDQIVGLTITTGNDGVCDTEAHPDDVQVIPVGNGKPYTICITYGNDPGDDDWLDSEIGLNDMGMPKYGGYGEGIDKLDLTNATTVTFSIDATSLEKCAITCTHELQHKTNAGWTGNDEDDDGIPDSYETGFRINGEDPKLDPYHYKTYVSLYYDPIYGYEINDGLDDDDDDEFIAYMSQYEGSEDPDQDWSKDGMRWHTSE